MHFARERGRRRVPGKRVGRRRVLRIVKVHCAADGFSHHSVVDIVVFQSDGA